MYVVTKKVAFMELEVGALIQVCSHPNKVPAILYKHDVVGVAGTYLLLYFPSDIILARVVVQQPECPQIKVDGDEVGSACWYQAQEGMWVWEPRCLIYQLKSTRWSTWIHGIPGAPIILQTVLGRYRHDMDIQTSVLAVCSQVPNWLLDQDVDSIEMVPGSNITAEDILHAGVVAPLGVGQIADPHVVYDGVSWPVDTADTCLFLNHQARFGIAESMTAAVVAGAFGTYEDGVCRVPIGELDAAAVGCDWGPGH